VRRTYWLAATSALGLLLSTQGITQSHSLADDAAAFGAREGVWAANISPDGQSIIYLAPAANGTAAAITANLTTRQVKPFLSSGSATEKLSWCAFVSNERLICRYGRIVADPVGLVGFARLVAINRDGSNARQLGQAESFYDAALRQYDGEIVDWLPGEDGDVLMARAFVPEEYKMNTRLVRTKQGLGVVRVNTKSMASRELEPPKPQVSNYITDGRGNVRLMAMGGVTGSQLTGTTKYYYRTQSSRDWIPLTEYVDDEDYVPLAVDATTDSLYFLQRLNGRLALYRARLRQPVSTELVASNPYVDIDDVERSSNGQRVIGYTLAEDQRESIYFDPDYKALRASLSKALPKLPLIHFAGASQDGNRILLMAGADNDPGRYFVFDRKAKNLAEVMLVRPELEKRALASVKPVRVKGPDGTLIPAYLTLPVGSSGKNLPAVVLPHGGPSARDEWGFDWLAQFLAARGYAVLQPNYRGSAGFGDAWLVENGFKSWKTSIGDITASAKWLASEGIADPNRMAVVGWSYGGYAALQSAVVEPQLFKAVAAIAPVTDLAMLKREYDKYTTAQLVRDFIGSGPHIEQGSPLRNASNIKVPVLLVHGDMDQNVGVAESVEMEQALKQNGTSVQFLRYRNLDHQLADAAARKEMLTAIGILLEKSIGR
jgi:dipeptidyl aminopeptidase/acylaminoacyl peptidase